MATLSLMLETKPFSTSGIEKRAPHAVALVPVRASPAEEQVGLCFEGVLGVVAGVLDGVVGPRGAGGGDDGGSDERRGKARFRVSLPHRRIFYHARSSVAAAPNVGCAAPARPISPCTSLRATASGP